MLSLSVGMYRSVMSASGYDGVLLRISTGVSVLTATMSGSDASGG